ncbi:unnamed protein product [Urochloa humidicola]
MPVEQYGAVVPDEVMCSRDRDDACQEPAAPIKDHGVIPHHRRSRQGIPHNSSMPRRRSWEPAPPLYCAWIMLLFPGLDGFRVGMPQRPAAACNRNKKGKEAEVDGREVGEEGGRCRAQGDRGDDGVERRTLDAGWSYDPHHMRRHQGIPHNSSMAFRSPAAQA